MKSPLPLVFIFLSFAILLANGKTERPLYEPTMEPGAECEVPLELLHPTQFTIGWREVRMRAAKLAEKKKGKLASYLEEHIVPIVIGPKGEPYILDHHHLVASLLEKKIRPTVPARIVANERGTGDYEFWKMMREHLWVHPYDEKGRGPISVTLLPASVTGLKDDPYRTLAWAVREEGGYDKHDEIPYADFKWASFFRAHLPFEDTAAGFAAAVPKAVELAKSPTAKALPGYLGAAP